MKKLLLILSCALSLSIAVPAYADTPNAEVQSQQTSAGFTKHSIQTQQIGELEYYLFTPAQVNENMPLVLYLHGGGENTFADESKILKQAPLGYINKCVKNSFPAYILVPKYPRPSDPKGTPPAWRYHDSALMELISHTIAEYPIDPKKISITGWSLGGDGTMDLASAHPDIFTCGASMIPFNPTLRSAQFLDEQVDGIKQIPIQIYTEELVGGIAMAKQVTQKIQDAGGNVNLQIIPGVSHNDADYKMFPGGSQDTYGVWAWLISQSK